MTEEPSQRPMTSAGASPPSRVPGRATQWCLIGLVAVAAFSLVADVAQFVFLDTLISTSGAGDSRLLLAQSDRLQLVLDVALFVVAVTAVSVFMVQVRRSGAGIRGSTLLWGALAAAVLAFSFAAVLGHTLLLEEIGVDLLERSILGAGLEIAGAALSLIFGFLAYGATKDLTRADLAGDFHGEPPLADIPPKCGPFAGSY